MPGLLAICLIADAASSPRAWATANPATPFAPASVHAAPGLQCKLHPVADASSDGVPVYPDSDGYARFYAVKAKAGDAAGQFVLDCVDAAGKSSSYAVDLASDDTFAPRALDLSKEPGTDRPALQGNPLGYTQEQLIQSGYGLQPDHKKDPAAYARWLASASRPGRILDEKHPSSHTHNVTTVLGEAGGGAFWVGSVLTGAPNYVSIEAEFNVPTAIAGGDQTTNTHVSIWDGVGGYGPNGLIQTGVEMTTNSTVANYGTFREYAGGDPDNDTRNGVPYGPKFRPSAGDQIYAQAWYCDSKGNINLNGGYGCTHMVDMTSGAVLDCTSPNGSPCWSVKALPLCSVEPSNILCFTLGQSAEFIIENQDGSSVPFTDFTPKVTMVGSAYSSTTKSYSQTISSDPNIIVLTDGTNLSTHLVVTLGSTNETYFNIEPGQPSFGFYCQGPLETTSGSPPVTRFTWATQGAGAKPPGKSECAWADRGPRGTEKKSGNTNVILGYLNAQTNLAEGKFMELGVYNDPAADNDMVVKEPPKPLTPPIIFTSNPSPP
jgi:hypothetical protein